MEKLLEKEFGVTIKKDTGLMYSLLANEKLNIVGYCEPMINTVAYYAKPGYSQTDYLAVILHELGHLIHVRKGISLDNTSLLNCERLAWKIAEMMRDYLTIDLDINRWNTIKNYCLALYEKVC